MNAAIEVEGVSRRFGATAAVNDVSLAVKQGEFLSLLGPSGCGKTTLLRLIGGFEIPDAGRIRLHGEDVTEQAPNLRRTNMVFQHLALFPHMNVQDNVAFSLTVSGKFTPSEIRRKVESALSLVRLEGYGARRIEQLSGGQKQRVAIARAVVSEPAALLLDEPLGALDLHLRLELQTELKRLHRELSSPFIFVTHDQGEAMAMSDRIALMDQGRIVQVGTPREIYSAPRNLFVAKFVGMVNLLPGRVRALDGEMVDLDVGAFSIRARAPEPLALGRPATAVLRYESVSLSRGEAAEGALRGQVTDVAFLGSTSRVTVCLDVGAKLVAELGDAPSNWFAPGETVLAQWDPRNVLAFPT